MKLSINTLLEIKMKQIKLKKYKFENRGSSRLKKLSGYSILVHQVSTEGTLLNDFVIRYSKSRRKLPFEISKEHIKSVVVGEPVLETREDTILKIFFDIFGLFEVHREEPKR